MIPSFFCRLQLPSEPPTVCVIAGDDAAPEVMRPTVEILHMLAPDIRIVEAQSGRRAQEHNGDAFPDVTREKD
jgi:isocitrate/isopropylmalate dehydrogenase